jgi:hypothetical protein
VVVFGAISTEKKEEETRKKRNTDFLSIYLIRYSFYFSVFPHFLIRSLEIAFQRVMKALMEINPSSPPSV